MWYAEIMDDHIIVVDGEEIQKNRTVLQWWPGRPRKIKKENHYQVEVPNPPDEYNYESWHKVDFVDDTKKSVTWKIDNDKWLNRKIRPERNELLKQTDWTQLPDNGLHEEKKLAYKEYRQKLRDLPDTIEYGHEQWPEEPK